MEKNIKSKNIKFDINTDEDYLIVDYFDTHKENFSKVIKSLLLGYITNSKNKGSRSIIDVLEDHTILLKQIVEKGIVIDNLSSNNLNTSETKEDKKEDKKEEDNGFNIDYLSQLNKEKG